jgi:MtN3 and saliva related transmembrane protein
MVPRWLIAWIGSLAGFCTTVSLVSQLMKIRRTKSAHDLSLVMFSVFGLGIALWLLYGIALRSWVMIAANGASLMLVIAILTLATRYEKARR